MKLDARQIDQLKKSITRLESQIEDCNKKGNSFQASNLEYKLGRAKEMLASSSN